MKHLFILMLFSYSLNAWAEGIPARTARVESGTEVEYDNQNPLHIRWAKKSDNVWVLDVFYWDGMQDFFTSSPKKPSQERLRYLNKKPLTLDPITGTVFLGDKQVGAWNAKEHSYEMNAPLRIDPLKNTIKID